MPVEAALLGILLALVSATGAGGRGCCSLLSRLLTLRVGAWFSTCGGCGVPSPSSRVTPTGSSPRGTIPPPFTGVLTPLLLSLFELHRLAALYVALVFVVPPFAAIAASDGAAEVVLVFDLLTILSLLLPLQLKHARAASIAVGGVTWAPLAVRRLAVEKIGGSLAFSGGGIPHMLELPSLTLPRVRVGLWGPPSLRLFSRGLPPQMFAQVFIHVRVIFSLHGEFDQEIDQLIVGMSPGFPLGHLPTILPSSGRNFTHEPQMWLCRPVGRGVHSPHQLLQLRHELRNTGSCGEFRKRG